MENPILFSRDAMEQVKKNGLNQSALQNLQEEAEKALRMGPVSVMDKEMTPPSGDKHDYMSVGPYWWPNPDTEDGLPYVRYDGEYNPERDKLDSVPLNKMGDAVRLLTLAYFYFEKEVYAERAVLLLRTWFLDEKTCMNPNLDYGQAIPDICEGRGVGIIDTPRLCGLVDYITLLKDSKALTQADYQGLVAWYAGYLQWLLTSDNGIEEGDKENNHGTWYDVQVAQLALFDHQEELAKQVLFQVPDKRIRTQIEPDGKQPLELARTKALTYSMMNLTGFFNLATLAEQIDIDLWNYQTEKGQGMNKAFRWLLPYILAEKEWPYPQIAPATNEAKMEVLRRAAIGYQDEYCEQKIDELAGEEFINSWVNLIYPKFFVK